MVLTSDLSFLLLLLHLHSRLQEGLLCWSRADCPDVPHWTYEETYYADSFLAIGNHQRNQPAPRGTPPVEGRHKRPTGSWFSHQLHPTTFLGVSKAQGGRPRTLGSPRLCHRTRSLAA